MPTSKEHWNAVFKDTADQELGWYEQHPGQTFRFLDLIPRAEADTIFLAGVGTSMLADDLIARGHRLVLNDISDNALRRLKDRVGDESVLKWLCHDMALPLPDDVPRIDVWIDRAVLHFLLDETSIRTYFASLNQALRPGGYALLAQFSITGAARCAGLDLHRYSLDELCERIGSGFSMVTHEDYTYINPCGQPRPYIYALFRKRMPGSGN